MGRHGRACLAICIHALLALTGAIEHGIPIEIQLWDTGRTPLAHMVDVTNEFGLKVLAEHNFLNENNIAFSPYGLTGIMVALYEGIDGESSYQIQRGMQMPWNRNVMRVGFRDIHRTLKTYFVPEEGFLAGLALNNENVTFTNQYKKVLRFYGFDLDRDQLPTLTPQSNDTENNVTMATPPSSPGDITTVTISGPPAREDTTSTTESPKEETTLNTNAETITDMDVQQPTTTVAPTVANAEMATGDTAPSAVSIASTASAETETTLLEVPTRPATTLAGTAATTVSSEITITTAQETTANDIEGMGTPEATATSAAISTVESRISSNEVSTETLQTVQMSTETQPIEQMTTETRQTEQMTTEATVVETSTSVDNETNLETLQRKKKSVADFIFTNSPPYVDDYLIYRAYDIPAELPKPTGGDSMFLVNGLRNVQVTYMHYDTILEHAYLPHLEASALRLPLDSERYYLLVVLPAHEGPAELGRLIARMARESDLRDVHAALRPRRVKAVVPSFTVKGHITLTTDLQKLGIRDVFEPRQRDFTLMTPQAGVYVRSIEQAVSVAIRKYVPDDMKRNRYVINHQPVQFGATYPFAYFVMDATIHVALMAGKMVDPLNTRIL